VLQEGELERVGSSQTLRVDVRVIAATNRDLETAVDAGAFREDLYYRLNVMPIFMPALRERPEDIPDLARFLVDKIAKQQGRMLAITDSAIRSLMRHYWPGNVRELENCLERSAIMSANGVIAQDVIGDRAGRDRIGWSESAWRQSGIFTRPEQTRSRRSRFGRTGAGHRGFGAGRLGTG